MKIIYSHKEVIDEVLKEISSEYKDYMKFCDLGCGRGERTTLFNEYNRDITGIDYIDYHSPNYDKFNFIKKDIFDSGFPTEHFDIILSFDTIEHLKEPEKLLKEIFRLLKNNGICILSTPNRYRLFNIPLVFLGIRRYPYCLDPKNHKKDYPEYWHIREYTVKELKHLIEKYNFKLEEMYRVFYRLSGHLGFKNLFNIPFCNNLILIIKKCSTKTKS